MKRSADKILTTHVGSLPNLSVLDKADPAYAQKLREAVAAVVAKQRAIGIDVVNEGEYTKEGDWLSYIEDRLGGFEERPGGKPPIAQGKDREVFADFYQYASARGSLFYTEGGEQIRRVRRNQVCVSPISYTGQKA